MDPRGNSVRRLQPPPRARAPSGRYLLLPALPPPPPEKAPKKPPHFPSRPRTRMRSTGRPFGPERPLAGKRPRAQRQGRHALRGGATAARRARRGGRPRDPRSPHSDRCPPVAATASPPFSAFLFPDTPTRTRGAKPRGAAQGGRVVARSQDERLSGLLPGLFSDLVARPVLPVFPPRRPCLRAPGPSGTALSVAFTFPPPTHPFPAAFTPRARRFLRDTWGTTASCGICQPASAVFVPARLCSEARP